MKVPWQVGKAGFGKTKVAERIPPLRPKKNKNKKSFNLPKKNHWNVKVDPEQWINIPVPAIVDENIFYAVQEQLEENRKLARARKKGGKYLLQGLLVCKKCCHAYSGKPTGFDGRKYFRYICVGVSNSRFYGTKKCDNKSILTNTIETAVWEEVKELLKNPARLLEEFQRRMIENPINSYDHAEISIENQINKLTRGISKIIDSYAQDLINKEEFEPRIKSMRQKLKNLEEQKENINKQKCSIQELKLIVTNLEDFSSYVGDKLENIEWIKKRDIIRLLVKRVDIDQDEVTVVFKVNSLLNDNQKKDEMIVPHCPGRSGIPLLVTAVNCSRLLPEFFLQKNIRLL